MSILDKKNFARNKHTKGVQQSTNTSLPFATIEEKHNQILTAEKSLAAATNDYAIAIDELQVPISVSIDEVDHLLSEIRKKWDSTQQTRLLDSCRNDVLTNIAGPLGLGNILAAYDKTGGNVTTSHNAKEGVYAQESEQYDRKNYTDKKYATSRDEYKEQQAIDGLLIDEYSGKIINVTDADCDHIKPLKEYHEDGGFIQTNEQKQNFASDKDNFALTEKSINRSMGRKTIKEWSEAEASEGAQTNKEKFGTDNRRTKPAVKRGEATAQKHLPTNVDWCKYYASRTTITGVTEAGKMGMQQVVGLFTIQVVEGLFVEVKDSFSHGLIDGTKETSFFGALKERLSRIANNVLNQWKKVVSAFRDGALSGFLSNLITTLINTLVTTSRQIIRFIRDGVMSIFKAIKLLLFPPEGMTLAEAAEAALKLLATGTITGCAILAEEGIKAAISTVPLFQPFSGTLSSVLVGAISAILSALAVYGIDHIDLFGIKSKQQHNFVMEELQRMIEETNKSLETSFDYLAS